MLGPGHVRAAWWGARLKQRFAPEVVKPRNKSCWLSVSFAKWFVDPMVLLSWEEEMVAGFPARTDLLLWAELEDAFKG